MKHTYQVIKPFAWIIFMLGTKLQAHANPAVAELELPVVRELPSLIVCQSIDGTLLKFVLRPKDNKLVVQEYSESGTLLSEELVRTGNSEIARLADRDEFERRLIETEKGFAIRSTNVCGYTYLEHLACNPSDPSVHSKAGLGPSLMVCDWEFGNQIHFTLKEDASVWIEERTASGRVISHEAFTADSIGELSAEISGFSDYVRTLRLSANNPRPVIETKNSCGETYQTDLSCRLR